MIYDCKVDSRGRVLLPVKIRKIFKAGARITAQPNSSVMTLEPLVRNKVTAEVDVICDPKELIGQAWSHRVAIKPVGEANGNAVIEATGEYADVKSFCSSLGYPPEDFDDLLVD